MPPDLTGGADTCVRDTSRFDSGLVSVPTLVSALPNVFPPSPPASPSSSPLADKVLPFDLVAASLPLTPSSSTESLAELGATSRSGTFLDAVFAKMPALAATARPVKDDRWQLAVVNERKLYARCFGGYADLCLRETVVDLLDRAAEELECDGLVICIDKHDPDLAELLHSLMYVGGSIMSPANSAHDATRYVLVGIDI